MTTGFQIINQQLWTEKDPSAVLTYTFDWNDWLAAGDTIVTSSYALQVRANDPAPLIKDTQGTTSGRYTYVKLSAGQVDKIYLVTCTVTTAAGLTDRRNFRVRVVNRSA